MPILGSDNQIEVWHKEVERRNNLVATGNRKGSTGAKVVLNVCDD
jgi:hypothetical protein